jgi:hypothetical protein
VARRAHVRLNIYLDSEELRRQIGVAAARAGVSLSEYCVRAIRDRLAEDGLGPPDTERARVAARAMDRARRRLGPLGVPVRELIEAGRR